MDNDRNACRNRGRPKSERRKSRGHCRSASAARRPASLADSGQARDAEERVSKRGERPETRTLTNSAKGSAQCGCQPRPPSCAHHSQGSCSFFCNSWRPFCGNASLSRRAGNAAWTGSRYTASTSRDANCSCVQKGSSHDPRSRCVSSSSSRRESATGGC